jgi:DNA replication protein DnaC
MRRYLLAHVPKAYWTFGTPEYFGDPKAWQLANEYLNNWDGNKSMGLGLEFYSPTQGTGKTFLVSWIARQLIQRGEDVYYTRFRPLMELYHRENKERTVIESRLRDSSVLVLDEVGVAISVAQNSYFAMEFEDLMRSRIDDNRVTLMTTNLTPDELDGEYTRVYSLLAAKQQRYAIDYEDARRVGDVYLINEAMIKSGEVRPLQ